MQARFIEITTDSSGKMLLNTLNIMEVSAHGAKTLIQLNAIVNGKPRQIIANESYQAIMEMVVSLEG